MPKISAKVNPNRNKITVITAIVIGIILLALLVVIFISPLVFGKPYFVVYTTSGEIFVGRASWLPRFSLTDVYLVKTGTPASEEAPGSNLQLVPLKDTPWSPKKLYFEREQVIFYGPIDEGSDVVTALKK